MKRPVKLALALVGYGLIAIALKTLPYWGPVVRKARKLARH